MIQILDDLGALLFVSDSPSTLAQLAAALELGEGQVEQALEVLQANLAASGPLHLVRLANGYQLATKPEYHALIARYLKPQKQKMTRSLLEVLAIVAYRQPVTISEIEAVRGVQSDHAVRNLAERRLIREMGRKHALGRPILYGTTSQFLHTFNLPDLTALPEIKELQIADPEPQNMGLSGFGGQGKV